MLWAWCDAGQSLAENGRSPLAEHGASSGREGHGEAHLDDLPRDDHGTPLEHMLTWGVDEQLAALGPLPPTWLGLGLRLR